jgi:hypothetical protein
MADVEETITLESERLMDLKVEADGLHGYVVFSDLD